ncbi:50S ribosomal protein L15 [Crocosphaera chwakensis]|uniref:Large ribosomal subunit protein uL15 n=1 Tax=Crocosphaera chwakensis CCY0110 TaxID=391612 RepID=A3IQ21_9CHRO|nr:50S ribosomal protein L15 [Crocosphaera chwakensis]EAZ91361.1 50S ribosomal protein L15 [Crocosphaera chwakensis CCY0110]
MRIHEVNPQKGSTKRRRRIGRGISAGQGASGGFGMRGQKSRSGTGTKAGFEGGQMPLYRRVPKLKHFPLVNPSHYTIINVGKLNSLSPNTEVTLESLMEVGLITSNDGPLKVLGDGELTVALTVKAAAFTKSAKAKIESAGGNCQDLSDTSDTPRDNE